MKLRDIAEEIVTEAMNRIDPEEAVESALLAIAQHYERRGFERAAVQCYENGRHELHDLRLYGDRESTATLDDEIEWPTAKP